MSFIDNINEALKPYHMKNHSDLQRYVREGMPMLVAQRIARAYGPCNAMSLRIMASGLSVIHDLEFAKAMVENMYDEIGRDKPEDSHILMFGKFMTAVGVDPNTEMQKGSPGDIMTKTFLNVKNETEEHRALALMHGFEAVFPYICGSIYKALRQNCLVTPEEAFFFIHHAEADVYHSDNMLQALAKRADTPKKEAECIGCSVYGAKAVHEFFDLLLSYP